MTPYFIYCLPRSGSAWLSAFLSGFDSFCYHEPFADMSPMQLAARFRDRLDFTTGAVDTGAYKHRLGAIAGAIPNVRQFVLRRDTIDVQASADANGVIYDAHEELGRLLNVTAGFPEIDYAQFGDVWYLKSIWEQLVGSPFDTERARLFIEFNVTRDLGKFFGGRPYLNRPDGYASERRQWH
jgi:hypothetical protein